MRTKSILACIPAALVLLAGCGNSAKSNVDDSAAEAETTCVTSETGDETLSQDSIAMEADALLVEEMQTEMLHELLQEQAGEDPEMLRKHCTPKALQQLKDAYDYDDLNENSLATWEINGRKVSSDYPIQLESIVRVAPNTYRAEFKVTTNSKPETSLMEYKLTEVNGEWKIDSYRQISYK